jgi:hypothetical protein
LLVRSYQLIIIIDECIEKIKQDKKKDDMADVIMQLEAYQAIQDLKSKKKKTKIN